MAVLSAWVIWPIFSSSVICASSASTSGAGVPARRSGDTSARRALETRQEAGASAAAPRNVRRASEDEDGEDEDEDGERGMADLGGGRRLAGIGELARPIR